MKINKEKYKVYTWKNWMYLHYIINPGVAIGELLFGQRIAKIGLVEKNTHKPLIERNFVPCPHCETLHGYKTWAGKRSTKNWFGLYCPNCKQIIPCLMNSTTFIILAITSPLWYPFKSQLKQRWLTMQEKRFANANQEELPLDIQKKNSWLVMGLSYGLLMFLFSIFIIAPLSSDELFSTKGLTTFTIWMIGGLLFGGFMKWYLGSKKIN